MNLNDDPIRIGNVCIMDSLLKEYILKIHIH